MFKNLTKLLGNRNFINITPNKYNKQCANQIVSNRSQRQLIHTTPALAVKTFTESENAYLFGVIHGKVPPPISALHSTDQITTEQDFNQLLNLEWRESSAIEIVQCFRRIAPYCVVNNLDVSDVKFDKLVDGLMDHVEKLTDDELLELLTTLSQMPPVESFRSHNFHDIWSALDDIACMRLTHWHPVKILQFCAPWYNLHLGKVCDFIFNGLERCAKFTARYSAEDLVRFFFFFNVCRRKTISFDYEHAVQMKIGQMTVDQMAVVALGFFKTKSRIKVPDIIIGMIDKVIEERNRIDSLTLCGILKCIRLSANIKTADHYYRLLDNLLPQMDRLSYMCVLHLALLGTTLQLHHPLVLEKVCERFLFEYANGDKGRLKDIERLLIPLTMYNYQTEIARKTIQTIFDDLHSEDRRKEKAQHPRCAPSALHFCSLQSLYSNELLNEYLDKDYIVQTYGKSSKFLPREILSLDISIEIECPNYKGNRLEMDRRRKSAKYLSEYAPSYTQHKKLSAFDKIVLDVVDRLVEVTGDRSFVAMEHVLPHFSRPDVVVCKDNRTNQFVRPFGFDSYTLGDVMRPVDLENYTWYSIVTVSWNAVIRNTNLPLGQMEMKRRQLGKIGYEVVYLIWNEYTELTTEGKHTYLKNILYK